MKVTPKAYRAGFNALRLRRFHSDLVCVSVGVFGFARGVVSSQSSGRASPDSHVFLLPIMLLRGRFCGENGFAVIVWNKEFEGIGVASMTDQYQISRARLGTLAEPPILNSFPPNSENPEVRAC